METKRVDKLRWREDAKNILTDLRAFQDHLTETYGYDGISLIELSINAGADGKLVTLRFENAGGNDLLMSLVEDGTTIDCEIKGIPT